jgi:hypothetical protein
MRRTTVIEAARLARKFPIVLRMLADGTLNLTTARLLGPHLSDENHEALTSAAAGKSKREVEVLLAAAFPQPDVSTSIRKVPAPRAISNSLAGLGEAPIEGSAVVPLHGPVAPAVGSFDAAAAEPVLGSLSGSSTGPTAFPTPQAPAPDRRREVVRPLAADRYEMRCTVSGATRDKLRFATALLRHAVPDGDPDEIIDRSLTALLENLARKKFAASPRPLPAQHPATGTRHVPAHVKRAVWLRDGARCAFVSRGRRRCRERGFLEFHHVRPYGVGGETTVENIELRCRAHNAYEAERFYGHRFVPPATRQGGRPVVHGTDEGEPGVQLGPDRVGAQPSAPVAAGDHCPYGPQPGPISVDR